MALSSLLAPMLSTYFLLYIGPIYLVAFPTATAPTGTVPSIPFATTRVSAGVTAETIVVRCSVFLSIRNMRQSSSHFVRTISSLPRIRLSSQLPDFDLIRTQRVQSVKETRVERWVVNRQTDRTRFRCHVFELSKRYQKVLTGCSFERVHLPLIPRSCLLCFEARTPRESTSPCFFRRLTPMKNCTIPARPKLRHQSTQAAVCWSMSSS